MHPHPILLLDLTVDAVFASRLSEITSGLLFASCALRSIMKPVISGSPPRFVLSWRGGRQTAELVGRGMFGATKMVCHEGDEFREEFPPVVCQVEETGLHN